MAKKKTTKAKYRNVKTGNPETAKRYAKKYYAGHKEEFKIRASARYNAKKGLLSDLTLQDWTDALEHFGNSCAYCGDKSQIQKEHIVPVMLGGGFTRLNIIPSCPSCNQSKKVKPLDQWYKYSAVYSDERLLNIAEWLYGKEEADKIKGTGDGQSNHNMSQPQFNPTTAKRG